MDFAALFAAVEADAMTLGVFETVNAHEAPRNAPGNGPSLDLWFQGIKPAPWAGGLASTSVVIHLQGRVYMSAEQQPYDAIDPAIVDASVRLIANYSAGFTLGGLVRNVDLLGESGITLGGEAGYVMRDNRRFRVVTLDIPLIVNDLMAQAA